MTGAAAELDWDALHDATLKRVTVDWRAGTCELTLAMAAGSASVLAAGLRRLVLPRAHPWGPSVSINHARVAPPTSGQRCVLEIEMQSGDTLCIEADSITGELHARQ